MKEHNQNDITQFIGALKQTILQSQYNAAKLVNTQLVQLYYLLGAAISNKAKQAKWGDKVLETISAELQKELKHLRGFSAENIKKMKRFYEVYPQMLTSCELAIQLLQNTDIENSENRSTVSTELMLPIRSPLETEIQFDSALANQLQNNFWSISFSNHFLIINSLGETSERIWYIMQSAKNNWSHRVLKNHLKNKIHLQKNLPNNFKTQLPEKSQRQAIAQFRDEYLLDFLSIDDTDDERILENKIVQNIRDFLLNLGTGFSFMGNQYKLKVENDEFFIDLLFYNRNLQALVAIDLKRGKFKPEHTGQLGFYLSVLDDKVRLPHENPSIGIILCKEKNKTVVEYALYNANRPMGVATFKTKNEMPEALQKALPGIDELKKLLK
ncbi:MAG: PDDEXK nuclease domain-containing protein [Prolixibacteraceae bacterium]|jgi:predicted nuclease of restriction endonuclease-like (RecB) superfamily|nr:PDDEXK nuclease domain-containing protein [Prolixibacteraceae bacterium]